MLLPFLIILMLLWLFASGVTAGSNLLSVLLVVSLVAQMVVLAGEIARLGSAEPEEELKKEAGK